jgi:hypothetical protein
MDISPPPPLQAQVPVRVEVAGSMRTADGAWRLDILRQGGREWCRVVHSDDVVDDLDLAQAQAILTAAGVDLAELTDTRPAA